MSLDARNSLHCFLNVQTCSSKNCLKSIHVLRSYTWMYLKFIKLPTTTEILTFLFFEGVQYYPSKRTYSYKTKLKRLTQLLLFNNLGLSELNVGFVFQTPTQIWLKMKSVNWHYRTVKHKYPLKLLELLCSISLQQSNFY